MESAKPSNTHLSVSIVVYNNSVDMLQRTLGSLKIAASVLDRVSVLLLDNASQPSYRAELAEMISQWQLPEGNGFTFEYQELPENLGFGGGHNRALEGLDSDFHLILNPDVELMPDALSTAIARLRSDNDLALLSPRVEGPNGEQEFLCKRYPSVLVLVLRAFAPAFLRRQFQQRLEDYQMEDICSGDEEAEVPLASGCCMLVRTAHLLDEGGFDERYFMYFEDFDLSLRLARRGRLLFYPAMRIVHHGGYAASKGVDHIRYFISSGLRFFRQHGWRFI